MRIIKATQQYEKWLGTHTRVVARDLKTKHGHMSEDIFSFFRATFYRWAQLWADTYGDTPNTPTVLAVGDLHVENFGTWRDREGRLVWGINDFDEAFLLPYTNDLVRLAASAHVAIAEHDLALDVKDACDAIRGYTDALDGGGRPFVLAEEFTWLRTVATGELRDPVHFWKKMDGLKTVRAHVPQSARKALEALLPKHRLSYRVATREAGLGSLGRQRFLALATWNGAKIAREAKALVPSAVVWARKDHGSHRLMYQAILDTAVRCPDPYVQVRRQWIVRRLAPDCSRIELQSLSKGHDQVRLLHAMGYETANIHLGSRRAIAAIRRDLKRRPRHWLHEHSAAMVDATIADFNAWRLTFPPTKTKAAR